MLQKMSLLEWNSENLLLKQQPKSSSNNEQKNKKRLTGEQVKLLEKSFSTSKKLNPERKLQLAGSLGIPQRQIAIWYQNKRARWKNQRLQLDHGALRLRLDAALAERRHLERELERLRTELRKARDTLRGFERVPPAPAVVLPPVPSSSCLLDHGVSSCSRLNGEAPPLEELYACLIGADELFQ